MYFAPTERAVDSYEEPCGINTIEAHGLAERSMFNSFSSRVLEYIYARHGKKFPLHGQGIYNCRRSNDEPKVPEHEIFDWCCLYPNKSRERALDGTENFKFCNENYVLPCLCIKDDIADYKAAIELGCKMFTSNNIYEAKRILNKLGML